MITIDIFKSFFMILFGIFGIFFISEIFFDELIPKFHSKVEEVNSKLELSNEFNENQYQKVLEFKDYFFSMTDYMVFFCLITVFGSGIVIAFEKRNPLNIGKFISMLVLGSIILFLIGDFLSQIIDYMLQNVILYLLEDFKSTLYVSFFSSFKTILIIYYILILCINQFEFDYFKGKERGIRVE